MGKELTENTWDNENYNFSTQLDFKSKDYKDTRKTEKKQLTKYPLPIIFNKSCIKDY